VTTNPQESQFDLSPDFRQGLEALQEAVEGTDEPLDADVRPVAKNDNKIVVRIGEFDLGKFNVSDVTYEHDHAVVYVQIPQTFPTGANAKGLAAVPPLKRADSSDLENNPDCSDGLADAIESATDHDDDVEDYSYNWNTLTANEPEDMEKFLRVAREFLREG